MHNREQGSIFWGPLMKVGNDQHFDVIFFPLHTIHDKPCDANVPSHSVSLYEEEFISTIELNQGSAMHSMGHRRDRATALAGPAGDMSSGAPSTTLLFFAFSPRAVFVSSHLAWHQRDSCS